MFLPLGGGAGGCGCGGGSSTGNLVPQYRHLKCFPINLSATLNVLEQDGHITAMVFCTLTGVISTICPHFVHVKLFPKYVTGSLYFAPHLQEAIFSITLLMVI